jgi:hypothetical protein
VQYPGVTLARDVRGNAPPATRWLALALSAVGVAGAVSFTVLVLTRGSNDPADTWFSAAQAVGAIVYPAAGLVLATRRPGNAIGWLLLAIGASFGISAVASGITDTAATGSAAWQWGSWLNTWSWAPGFVITYTFLLLLFPTGRLPSPGWRWAARLAGAAIGLQLLGMFDGTAAGPG